MIVNTLSITAFSTDHKYQLEVQDRELPISSKAAVLNDLISSITHHSMLIISDYVSFLIVMKILQPQALNLNFFFQNLTMSVVVMYDELNMEPLPPD